MRRGTNLVLRFGNTKRSGVKRGQKAKQGQRSSRKKIVSPGPNVSVLEAEKRHFARLEMLSELNWLVDASRHMWVKLAYIQDKLKKIHHTKRI